MTRRPFGQVVAVAGGGGLAEEIIVIQRPQAAAALAGGHAHPGDRGPLGAERMRQAVDVGHDGNGGRHVGDVELLHVDHDQRRLGRFEMLEHPQPSALLHHPVDDVIRHFHDDGPSCGVEMGGWFMGPARMIAPL
jgi:hypothetical protein